MKLLLVLIGVVALAGCSPSSRNTPVEQQAATPAAATITVTSKSPEAVAHFEKGQVLFDNLRIAEAAAEFAAALKLDPDFVLARALHGQATPGPDGLKELESAAGAASALPEAERVLIQGLLASRRGEFGAATESFAKVTELAPGDWRGHYLLGTQLMNADKYPESVKALRKAAELNPQAGGAHNMLGYAALRQREVEDAIAAFREYARVMPQEPNPQDSLGEALLAAGRFEEAETAFRKAAEISPQFWTAWDGIAYAKFYAGDVAGARDAAVKAREAARLRGDKVAADRLLAVMAAAQGKMAEANKALDAAETLPGVQPAEVSFVPVDRAFLLIEARRYADALAQISTAWQRADTGQYPAGLGRNLRREALRVRITAETRMGDKAAALKTAATLDQETASRSDDPAAQTAMHYGRGMAAVAEGDLAAARSHFEQCVADDAYCKWQLVMAAEKAGDKAGASTAKEQVLKLYLRDPVHLYVRSRLTSGSRTTN